MSPHEFATYLLGRDWFPFLGLLLGVALASLNVAAFALSARMFR